MLIIWAAIIAVTSAAPERLAENLMIANNFYGKNSNSICKRPVCIQEASMILRKIDPNINPCDNFYRFACGRFLNETVIPNNTFRVNAFSSIEHNIQEQILISLSDESKKDDPPIFQTMKSCYQMCMDTEKIARNTEKELKEVLKKLGDWPILHGLSWNGSNFDWQKFVIESGQMGYNTNFFINANVGYDLYDSTKYIIQIDYPQMGITPKIPPNNDKNNRSLGAYVHYMRKLALILGANIEEAEEDVLNIVEFEKKLMNISRSATSEHRMTVGELEKKYPKISWIEYVNGIIALNTKIDQNEEILVMSSDFLDAFYVLITNTPKRIIANYGMWRIVRESVEYMGDRLEDALAEFRASIYGKRIQRPRRDVCVSFLKQHFTAALGSLYVRRYFDQMAKAKVVSLVDNIRASLRNMIEQADWMDSITKSQALDKLDSMSQYIGYPDELINDEKLNDYYKDLKVHPDSLFKSRMSLKKFENEKISLYIRRMGNESKWTGHRGAYTTNAFFNQVENLMDIRAGILQGESFNAARPNYLNYGSIGWTVGHEMTHGFDDSGSQFDKTGVLADWWQPETKRKFLEKVNCFIKQYSNYTVKEIGMKVKGQQTVGENIADNGGLKAAYHAYVKWAEKNYLEPQLPGLDYTPQQMFWISAAGSYCEKVEKESLKSSVRDGPHSPSEFCVIGSMSNLPEFSKDFQCPPKSPMNPDSKCTIW